MIVMMMMIMSVFVTLVREGLSTFPDECNKTLTDYRGDDDVHDDDDNDDGHVDDDYDYDYDEYDDYDDDYDNDDDDDDDDDVHHRLLSLI